MQIPSAFASLQVFTEILQERQLPTQHEKLYPQNETNLLYYSINTNAAQKYGGYLERIVFCARLKAARTGFLFNKFV